jgi:hypothetical protein
MRTLSFCPGSILSSQSFSSGCLIHDNPATPDTTPDSTIPGTVLPRQEREDMGIRKSLTAFHVLDNEQRPPEDEDTGIGEP